jgi:hypothetical protein
MLDVVLADGQTVAAKLSKGDLVGQVALVAGSSHEFSVRAAVYAEILYLDRVAFEEISGESPRLVELVETAAIRQEQLVRAAMTNLDRFPKLSKISVFQQQNQQQQQEAGRRMMRRANTGPTAGKLMGSDGVWGEEAANRRKGGLFGGALSADARKGRVLAVDDRADSSDTIHSGGSMGSTRS